MTEATVVELFENHSVDEVRRICADIRNDVESRKMELRFLVGERHRDVIEASDSILCMKEYSQFVTDKLAQLESACVYKSSALSTPSRVKDQKAQDPKKLIAAQLKLLLDVSEMIWTALDEFDYSAAVEYFLLGRHLAVKMQLTSEMLAAHVNARVLVKRQWVALDHIEGTIAAACRKQIALHNVTDDMLCQALAALLVLEDQTMRASLEEFLIGRTAALKGISGADDALDSQACVDVTQRLTVMARILMQTLESVNALYLPQGQICSLLSQMSKWSPREITGFAGENLFEHLPENVVNYRITSTNQSRQAKSPCPSPTEGTSDVEPSGILACPLSAECLTDPTNRWWQSTLDLCHQHLSTALNSISDLATFVEMRTTLLNLTANVKPLGRHVDLWCEIYQSAFLDRLQVLLETHLGAIFDEFEASLLHLAKPLDQVAAPSDDVDDNDVNSLEEKDLAAFVWSQSLSGTSSIVDLQPDNSTSLQVDGDSLSLAYFACLVGRRDLVPESPTSSTDSCVPGPLRWRLSRLLDGAAKTYAAFDWCDDRHHGNSRHELNQKRRLITPALKRICSKFNRRLCETVATAAKNAAGDETPVWKVLLGVVTRLLDRCCSMAKRAIVDLKEDGGMKSRGAFCVARACFALLDVYPGLGATVVAATAKLLTEESKSYTTWTDVQRLRQVWLSTSRKLRFIAARLAYVAVLQATVQGPALEVLYSKLVSAFSASGDPDQSLVAITSQWSEITLKPTHDNDDSGIKSSVIATLKIPSYPTWPLHEALLSLSKSLVHLSVHLLPGGSLTEALGLQLAEGLLSVYKRLTDDEKTPLTQPQALQLMFDIRFILRLFVWPLASTKNRSAASSQLEDLTDEELCHLIDAPPSVDGVSGLGHDLLARLERAVDPFDLEMSSERMNTNIGQAVHMSSLLYASISPASAGRCIEGLARATEDTSVGFLTLTPGSSLVGGSDGETAGSAVSFGLLPFSLSLVRPPPTLTRPLSQQPSPTTTLEKRKEVTVARTSATDYSWFSGLPFT